MVNGHFVIAFSGNFPPGLLRAAHTRQSFSFS
jgi:hypothetical protein